MHPDKRKAPQRKASCSQRAPAIAPLDRKLNLVNQLVSLIDRELRQPLVEIIAAGHHSVSLDLLMQMPCIRGFQRDAVGSDLHICILRQNPDAVLLRVEVIDKDDRGMRGIRSPDEVFPLHDRFHIDKVRWRELVLMMIILHVPEHLLIPLMPQEST